MPLSRTIFTKGLWEPPVSSFGLRWTLYLRFHTRAWTQTQTHRTAVGCFASYGAKNFLLGRVKDHGVLGCPVYGGGLHQAKAATPEEVREVLCDPKAAEKGRGHVSVHFLWSPRWTFIHTRNIHWDSTICNVLWRSYRNPEVNQLLGLWGLKNKAQFYFWNWTPNLESPWLLPSNWITSFWPSQSLEWPLPSISFSPSVPTAPTQTLSQRPDRPEKIQWTRCAFS